MKDQMTPLEAFSLLDTPVPEGERTRESFDKQIDALQVLIDTHAIWKLPEEYQNGALEAMIAGLCRPAPTPIRPAG